MNSVVLPIAWLLSFKTVNRKVQGVPQSQTTASPRYQEEEKMTKNKQTNAREAHRPDPSSIREVIKHVLSFLTHELQHDKTNKMTSVRPAKTRISLGIRPVWSESLLCAQWVAKDLMFLHADSEDSDQTGSALGAHAILLVLSWRGSHNKLFSYY